MIGENKPKIKPYDFDEIKLLTKLVHEYGFSDVLRVYLIFFVFCCFLLKVLSTNNTTGVRPVTRIFLQQSFNFDNVST